MQECTWHCPSVRGQLEGGGSPWVWTQDCLGWWQVSWPAEPSYCLFPIIFKWAAFVEVIIQMTLEHMNQLPSMVTTLSKRCFRHFLHNWKQLRKWDTITCPHFLPFGNWNSTTLHEFYSIIVGRVLFKHKPFTLIYLFPLHLCVCRTGKLTFTLL